MTDNHNCLFQVSLFKAEHHLVSFDWTGDKDAVIEAMDEINYRYCRDLQVCVEEHDHRRGVLKLFKNGHLLVATTPFDLKPVLVEIVEAVKCVNSGDHKLRAGVTTRGNGGITIDQSVSIGG